MLQPAPCPRPPEEAPPAPVGLPITDYWRQWIAENRLRDCTHETMLKAMNAAGVDGAAAHDAVVAMDRDPVFLAARRHQQLQRKAESVLANQQRLLELAPNYAEVERRGDVSAQEFIERYVIGSRPVVLTNVTRDWPAMQRWSPADLKTRFGHLDVDIQAERSADPKFEQNKAAHRRTVRLGDFVDQVLHAGASNDHYLTATNGVMRRPEFASLFDDIGILPEFCDRSRLAQLCWFWFGPAGTDTPLHHDEVMLLHTQIVGRKRWRFISPLETPRLYNSYHVFSPISVDKPNLARHPHFAKVKVLEVEAGPGDTVFLPLGWWHQVTALEVSVSFSFANFTFPNDFKYRNPDIRNWY